jgi:signal transduction histidine kinase
MAADLERAVAELQTERDTVAALLRERRELIASASHELRTPVATLRGYLESTLAHWNGQPPATLRHDLEVMERETIHLQRLIGDLFTLARAEVGRLELRRTPTDVGLVVRRIVETQAPLAWQGSRVQVVAVVASGLPLALVDASRLEQVLRNLLHNAVRHTPPGGIVALEASDEAGEASVVGAGAGAVSAGWVRLRVKDTGEGIAPEELPHIWERFYRAESARARGDGGSGLGLALVKELTEAMGGTVGVESTPGEGSCFTVRLPQVAQQTAQQAAQQVERVERGEQAERMRAQGDHHGDLHLRHVRDAVSRERDAAGTLPHLPG